MGPADIDRLRDAALLALEQGRIREALSLCLELEQRAPKDPEWPRRTAKVCRAGRMVPEEVEALNRAARIYVQQGDGLKAAAVSKQILQLAPKHVETLGRMARLKGITGGSAPATLRPPQVAMPRAASWVKKSSTPLDGIELKAAVPGARRIEERGAQGPGVYQIPLGDDLEGSFSLPIAELAPQPPPPKTLAYGAPAQSEDALILGIEAEMEKAKVTNAALADTPLFRDLDEELFGDLLVHAQLHEFAKGAEIFHQGDRGDALFVVAEGTVGVIAEGPPRRGLSKLAEGDFFGEIALVTDQPRTATVVALSDVQLIGVDRATIKKLMEKAPEILTVLLRFFRDRSVARLFQTHPIFTSLSSRDQEALLGRFRFLEFEPGAPLLTAGQAATGLVVLLSGQAEVDEPRDARRRAPAKPRAPLGPGDLVGERSLMAQQPATQSVSALTKCFALELPAAAFMKIVDARPEAKAYVLEVLGARKDAVFE